MQTIELDSELYSVLSDLAEESGTTPETLLAGFIKKADSERHVIWSRKEQKHIRVKCTSKSCKEQNERKNGDWAD